MTPERVRLCLQSAPRIGGDVFLKFFAHGAPERDAEALLGQDLPLVLQELERLSRERGFALHYVAAWETRRALDAIVEGRAFPASSPIPKPG
jgi:hypothetical protein